MASNATYKLVVLGAAESGVGTAILAQAKGVSVFVSDYGTIAPRFKAKLASYGIPYEEGQHTAEVVLNAEEVVKSPGIPHKAPIIKQLKEKGIPVISEIEFAQRYTTAKLIGITGTNGKTTTTALIYHILKKAGLNVGLGGNIGQSFAEQVATQNFDYYVLELSSFQLDDSPGLHLYIAILLNITPDHLDRYDYKVENYAAAKFNVGANQTPADYFIYCADDALTAQYANLHQGQATRLGFSIKTEANGAFLDATNHLVINNQSSIEQVMPITDISIKGKHNVYNAMAAAMAARVLDLRKEVVRESLMDFQGIEHRLEFVTKVHGIEFINDSKATNINSTWYALESMNNPTVLILGGVDKGNDYAMIAELVRTKVKAIVCMGTDNTKILEAFASFDIPMVETDSATQAVKAAYRLATNGDTVLLSPACASFDLFENYEDRGRQFKQAVREL